MAGESVIRRRDVSPEAVAEEDYQSFCEALGSSARGRAFLTEYARRNRHADTEAVLEALSRLEETAIKQSAAGAPEADRIRQDLRALLDTLRTARPQTENSPTAIKAATLAALIDFTQARIEAVVGMPEGTREIEQVVAVPSPDEPELPIPHPTAAAPGPIMALVHAPPKTVERVAEKPNVVATTSAVVAPLTKARELTGLPIVEFDYRTHQAARPVQPQVEQDEAWTQLAPPSLASAPVPVTPAPVVAPAAVIVPAAIVPTAVVPAAIVPPAPVAVAPVEVARAPEPVSAPIIEPAIAPVVETVIAPVAAPEAPQPETYELWLDEPVAAPQAPAAVTFEPPNVTALEAPSFDEPVFEAPTFQTIAAPVGTPAQHFVGAPAQDTTQATSMTAIEALVQQMEKTAPAAPLKGRTDADPLAPLMALSEEERIALFT